MVLKITIYALATFDANDTSVLCFFAQLHVHNCIVLFSRHGGCLSKPDVYNLQCGMKFINTLGVSIGYIPNRGI